MKEKLMICNTTIKMQSQSFLVMIYDDGTIMVIDDEAVECSVEEYIGTASSMMECIITALCRELALDRQFKSEQDNEYFCDWY